MNSMFGYYISYNCSSRKAFTAINSVVGIIQARPLWNPESKIVNIKTNSL